MFNQNNYDSRWNNRRNDRYSNQNRSRRNWGQRNKIYCQRCGERQSIPDDMRNTRGRNRNYNQQSYRGSYRNRSSIGTTFMPILVVIAFIMIVASCNVDGDASTSSDIPMGEDAKIEQQSNIPSSTVNQISYQPIEAPTNTEEKVQGEQPYQPEQKKYIVQPGDTLYRIAVNMLGNGSRWVEIAQLNNLERSSNGVVLIHPGQVLLISE